MDNAEKRVRETIENMPDKDLYSIGDVQTASEEAREKAYRLQKEAKENESEDEKEEGI
ncbi:MAG: hypothetical protein LIO93_04490 [Bacteroidales bacterium]|nr:hypothetical protein [Bacteroidales bacterium]